MATTYCDVIAAPRQLFWPEGASLHADFATQQYYADKPVADIGLTSSHSGAWLPVNGVLTWFAPNSPLIAEGGLWSEPTRTNLYKYSGDLMNAAWGGFRVSKSIGDESPLPGYNYTLAEATETNVNGGGLGLQSVDLIAGTYTMSAPCKAGNGGWVGFRVEDNAAPASNVRVFFNPATGALSGAAVAGSGFALIETIATEIKPGEYWVSVTLAISGALNARFAFFVTDGSSLPVTAGKTVQVGVAQLELGTFATSPIITAGDAAQRTGPRNVIDVPDGGRAFAVDMDLLEPAAGQDARRILDWNNGSAGEAFNLFISAGGAARIGVSQDGIYRGATLVGAPILSAGRNILYGVAGLNYLRIGRASSVDSAVVSNLPMPAGLSKMAIGGTGYSTTSNTYMRARRFSEIRNITDPEAAFAQVKAMAEGLAA